MRLSALAALRRDREHEQMYKYFMSYNVTYQETFWKYVHSTIQSPNS
jgi:hypothetical protein